jgi:hypothetical protein
MSDARIRELERRAASGDPEAVGRLRSWQARLGDCDHALYVKKVEEKSSFPPGYDISLHMRTRRYPTTVACEFCSYSSVTSLAYNPLNELHRLQIELTQRNGRDVLTFSIDKKVTDCFRLGRLRLGPEQWSPLGTSLVTTSSDWLHVGRFIAPRHIESTVLHVSGSGLGAVRVLHNSEPIGTLTFKTEERRNQYRQRIQQLNPITKGLFLKGPFYKNHLLAIQIRHTPNAENNDQA